MRTFSGKIHIEVCLTQTPDARWWNPWRTRPEAVVNVSQPGKPPEVHYVFPGDALDLDFIRSIEVPDGWREDYPRDVRSVLRQPAIRDPFPYGLGDPHGGDG